MIIVVALGSALGLHVTATSAANAPPQFASTLIGLFGAACGGFIARKVYFAPIAMFAYAILWGSAIFFLDRISSDLTYMEVVSNNVVPIAVSLLGVCIGALFGQQIARLTASRSGAV